MALNRDQILGASDITTQSVDVPEWGGTVLVRGLTGRERDSWEASNRIQRGREMVYNQVDARARLVVRALVDDNGDRLFKDTDAGALGAKSGKVLDRLFDVAAELSGITDASAADAEGNSEPDPSDGSISDSPETSDEPSPNSSTPSAPPN